MVAARISGCLVDISSWMKEHHLQLIMAKTELLVFPATPTLQHDFTIQIDSSTINPSSSVSNLGVIFDDQLTFKDHIAKRDVLKSRLVSYFIVSLVSGGGHLLGHLLWLTGNCVQLNWSSILLDGYKKCSLLFHEPSREDLLVRRPKSVKTIDSTVRLHRSGHSQTIAYIYLLSYCLFHFCFSFYNQFLICVSCCLLACVFDSVLFLGLLINYCCLICYLFSF